MKSQSSYSKKYLIANNYAEEDLYPPQQQAAQRVKEEQNKLNISGDNPELIDTEELNYTPSNNISSNNIINTNSSTQVNSYKIYKLHSDSQLTDQKQQSVSISKNQKINSILESTYKQDKFINGAIIAIKSQNLAIKYVVDHIKEMTDRTVSEGYVRKVWEHWSKYKNVYFSTSQKTRMYTKHEAIQLYDAIFKQYNPTTSHNSIIPKIKEILQRHAITKKVMVTYSQFEEVKGLDTEETYMAIKDVIDSGVQSEEPKWVDVSVRMMISASQFEYKKQIEIQCFNQLKNTLKYDNCIDLIGVVMGETLNGRGKFIYIHCKYDQSILKRNKYLKRFLLEVIPDYFYSYNCVHSQKVAIFRYSKFLSIQCQYTESQNRKKYLPIFSNSAMSNNHTSSMINSSLNTSYHTNNLQFQNNHTLNINNSIHHSNY